jgi:hypothetical protein
VGLERQAYMQARLELTFLVEKDQLAAAARLLSRLRL